MHCLAVELVCQGCKIIQFGVASHALCLLVRVPLAAAAQLHGELDSFLSVAQSKF